ncbi:hypothetical protein [Flavobacterium pedocola]
MKVERFEIQDWNDIQTGLWLAENDEWVLVKHIPVDYVIDGFRLYKKEFIISRRTDEDEKLIERVLKLKNESDAVPENFEFLSTENFLKWSENKFDLFEFQDEDETELFYGRINTIKNLDLIIDMVLSDGTLEPSYEFVFDIDAIRVITFCSDYFNSIRLLYKDEIGK